MNQEIIKTVDSFRPISLQDMDTVALMKRSDTKFLVPQAQVLDILASIKNDYNILQVGDNRLMTYNSLYYDTPEQDFYKWHHNGKVNRLKVRIRNYVESNLHFLEIKRKNGKGITQKKRIKVEGFEQNLTANSKNFIRSVTEGFYDLVPVLENEFNRITLVSEELKERVTIDFNLNFKTTFAKKSFDNLAIIEIKQEGVDRNSPLFQVLKKMHILPYSISKYCIGIISLYSQQKSNAFKSKLLKIKKLSA